MAAPVAARVRLPDRENFKLDHVFLNAAYSHPMGRMTYDAIEAYLQRRRLEPDTPWASVNPRDAAVERFARLINADPADIAVVPSTMVGENLVVQALNLGPDAGVVTDAFHYSPEIYGEYHRRGVPVAVAAPRDNRIALDDLDRLIDHKTRLVAISAVSSDTAFQYDLGSVCEIAHAKGALVYADVIQAAGAVPLDVKASGVDFCCCGGYKWLMGEFGVAFLYVRPDRLKGLQRPEEGWRQYKTYESHVYPFDTPGDRAIDYTLSDDAVGLFEVATPSWGALAGLTGSLDYLHAVGVENIAAYRAPLIAHLQDEMPRLGFLPLTPRGQDAPTIAFARRDAAKLLGPPLEKARIKVQLSKHRLRISASVYNDVTDIERLLSVLARAVNGAPA
ncbi:MAG TPA: aminotransferase class V-fold PLP-dependent enzyme [Caulobacteraceae bacterium]|nr:aminotransferase class V-fold PLP-dependent enzyme [Caulobacteraceae bacterium]